MMVKSRQGEKLKFEQCHANELEWSTTISSLKSLDRNNATFRFLKFWGNLRTEGSYFEIKKIKRYPTFTPLFQFLRKRGVNDWPSIECSVQNEKRWEIKAGCRDPRTAESVRIFKGGCRNLRTAESVRILKSYAGLRGPPNRSEFLKRDAGIHGLQNRSEILKRDAWIGRPRSGRRKPIWN